MVHRDIKPDNLLIDDRFRIKISDFGIALRPERRTRLTTAGIFFGSPDYVSPEQVKSESALDVRSDLYSLGATFYNLIVGKAPFDGASAFTVMLKHTMERPDPILLYRPEFPRSLALCLDWLMIKDPEGRPANPNVLLQRLAEVAKELGLDPDRPPASGRLARVRKD
jgi:serine/threonine protein kinase